MRIKVVGYHGKGNLGDDMYRDAFARIFPNSSLSFSDIYAIDKSFDAVVFGGGNIMDTDSIYAGMPKVPFAVVSTGAPKTRLWKELCDKARMCVFRDGAHAEIGNTVWGIPDAVFACELASSHASGKLDSKLFVANSHLIPRHHEPTWKTMAHQWFLNEIPQAFDELSFEMEHVPFKVADNLAAGEISMRMRTRNLVVFPWSDPRDSVAAIAKSSFVVSMRLHGCIVATMLGKNFLAISAHDKISNFCYRVGAQCAGYFAFNKSDFRDRLDKAAQADPSHLIAYSTKARETWHDLSTRLTTALTS